MLNRRSVKNALSRNININVSEKLRTLKIYEDLEKSHSPALEGLQQNLSLQAEYHNAKSIFSQQEPIVSRFKPQNGHKGQQKIRFRTKKLLSGAKQLEIRKEVLKKGMLE